MFKLCLVLPFAFAVTALPDQASARALHATGTSGRPIRVIVEGSWDHNCAPKAFPDINITEPPVHGTVSLQGEAYTIRRAESGSSQCIGHPGSGQGVYYTAQPGFHGTDHFAFTVQFVNGSATSQDATVTVR